MALATVVLVGLLRRWAFASTKLASKDGTRAVTAP
jgi:hypothetical protein